MSDDIEPLTQELKKFAIDAQCYVTWVAVGGGMGGLWGSAVPGVGTVAGPIIGAVAGLLYASLTCKPMSDKLHEDFMTSADLDTFHAALRRHAPITRDQALALATLARSRHTAAPQMSTAASSTFGRDLRDLLRQMETAAASSRA